MTTAVELKEAIVLYDRFVEGFCEIVGGWIPWRREHTLNLDLVAEFLERVSDKRGTIVMDDLSRDAEAINDVVFNEHDYVISFDFSERDGLCPFGKIIGYCQDKPMSFG